MKIALISNYRPDRSYSMLGYAEMLGEGLRARGLEVVTLHPPSVLGRLAGGRGEVVKWISYLDKYLFAFPYLRWKIRGADVVHVCDHSNSMYLKCAGNKPQVITCHDLLAVDSARGKYPSVSVRLSGRILQRWIERGLDRARYVVCDSQKTMDDFCECFPNNAARILVIYLGLNRAFHPPPADEIRGARGVLRLPPGTKYLLHVGGNSWYKNRLGAMQIFAALRQQPEFREFVLVMAGAPWNGQLREFARTQQIENAVIEAANASDTTLTSLYGGAEALLFPSLEEGFGWPVLEAQACGCPVITTNRPPMTEVAGEAAIFIDPSHPQSAANTIQEQWNRRSILRESGFRNLQRFSLEKMFDAYCSAYNEAVSTRR